MASCVELKRPGLVGWGEEIPHCLWGMMRCWIVCVCVWLRAGEENEKVQEREEKEWQHLPEGPGPEEHVVCHRREEERIWIPPLSQVSWGSNLCPADSEVSHVPCSPFRLQTLSPPPEVSQTPPSCRNMVEALLKMPASRRGWSRLTGCIVSRFFLSKEQ